MLAAVAEKLPHPEVAEVTTVPFVPCRPGILNVMVDELWAAKLELLKVNDTAVAELVSELLRVRLVVLFWNFVISGDEGIEAAAKLPLPAVTIDTVNAGLFTVVTDAGVVSPAATFTLHAVDAASDAVDSVNVRLDWDVPAAGVNAPVNEEVPQPVLVTAILPAMPLNPGSATVIVSPMSRLITPVKVYSTDAADEMYVGLTLSTLWLINGGRIADVAVILSAASPQNTINPTLSIAMSDA
jgi:hypothetical protein